MFIKRLVVLALIISVNSACKKETDEDDSGLDVPTEKSGTLSKKVAALFTLGDDTVLMSLERIATATTDSKNAIAQLAGPQVELALVPTSCDPVTSGKKTDSDEDGIYSAYLEQYECTYEDESGANITASGQTIYSDEDDQDRDSSATFEQENYTYTSDSKTQGLLKYGIDGLVKKVTKKEEASVETKWISTLEATGAPEDAQITDQESTASYNLKSEGEVEGEIDFSGFYHSKVAYVAPDTSHLDQDFTVEVKTIEPLKPDVACSEDASYFGILAGTLSFEAAEGVIEVSYNDCVRTITFNGKEI